MAVFTFAIFVIDQRGHRQIYLINQWQLCESFLPTKIFNQITVSEAVPNECHAVGVWLFHLSFVLRQRRLFAAR